MRGRLGAAEPVRFGSTTGRRVLLAAILATNATLLIAARGLQGVGGALLKPGSLAMASLSSSRGGSAPSTVRRCAPIRSRPCPPGSTVSVRMASGDTTGLASSPYCRDTLSTAPVSSDQGRLEVDQRRSVVSSGVSLPLTVGFQ